MYLIENIHWHSFNFVRNANENKDLLNVLMNIYSGRYYKMFLKLTTFRTIYNHLIKSFSNVLCLVLRRVK